MGAIRGIYATIVVVAFYLFFQNNPFRTHPDKRVLQGTAGKSAQTEQEDGFAGGVGVIAGGLLWNQEFLGVKGIFQTPSQADVLWLAITGAVIYSFCLMVYKWISPT